MQALYAHALARFNSTVGTAYTPETVRLVPITRNTGVKKKNQIIEELHAKSRHVSKPSDFNHMTAEAIVGMDGDRVSAQAAILFRADVKTEGKELDIFFHELGHVFALTHEYGGSWFQDLLDGDNIQLFSGYMIWKEFVADIIGNACRLLMPISIANANPQRDFKERLLRGSHDFVSSYLSYLACSKEFGTDAMDAVRENRQLPFAGTLSVLSDKCRQERFWEIDTDFMEDVGNQYLLDKTYLALDLEYEKMKK